MLYPQTNAFRWTVSLDGYWRIKADPSDVGRTDHWYDGPLPSDAMEIAVPGAWNEQLAEQGWMNYVGEAWYETRCMLPLAADGRHRIWLRVHAADHAAEIWLNGRRVGRHVGGYLPFEIELTDAWSYGAANRLTIAVDSRLSLHTLPQDIDPAQAPYDEPPYARRHHFPPARFDFFPYGGLTRGAAIVVTPRERIAAIRIHAGMDGSFAGSVFVDGGGTRVRIRVLAPGEETVCSAGEADLRDGVATVRLSLSSPQLWCPADPALYTALVELLDEQNQVLDSYAEPFGFREIRVEGHRLLLNGEPLYLAGFGKHEEFPIVGRGRFDAGVVRDFELMRWTGANSFRTSHYPYGEEILRLADRLGFLVIDEVPAVSLGFWSDRFEELAPLLESHTRALEELAARDGNHPSVILWSVVNEPNLWNEPHYQTEASRTYFRSVYDCIRRIDPTRPVMTITIPAFREADIALEACDVIGINRYYGWYTDPADLDAVRDRLGEELDALYRTHTKPVVVTEFGADTIEGYHATSAQMFTEEYQAAFLLAYGEVISSRDFCVGEHVWNFADFRTPQNHRRVVLNRKGVFTRSREPKGAAFVLRERWHRLVRILANHRPRPGEPGFLIPDIRGRRKI